MVPRRMMLKVSRFSFAFSKYLHCSLGIPTQQQSKQTAKAVRKKSLCTPHLEEHRKKDISNIVAVKISPHQIISAHINRDFQLLQWNKQKFINEIRTHNPTTILEEVSQYIKELPKADIYVLEQQEFRLKHLGLFQNFLLAAILETIVITLLDKDYCTSQQHTVFTVNPDVISKSFNLRVGTERVSCQTLINDLILKRQHEFTVAGNSKTSNSGPFSLKNLDIPENLAHYYFQQQPNIKEDLGNVLLLGLAFYMFIINS